MASKPNHFSDDTRDHAAAAKRHSGNGYLASIAATALISAICAAALPFLDPANIVMLFLLPVVVIAARYGKGPAIFSTVLGVAVFDYGFVPPQFSFEISDLQYLVMFAVMLVVGWFISDLTANLRRQAEIAAGREALSLKLHEFSSELSGSMKTEQVIESALRHIKAAFRVKAAILMPDENGHLQGMTSDKPASEAKEVEAIRLGTLDLQVAQWAFDTAKPAGPGTGTLSSSACAFIPLVASMRSCGILAVRPQDTDWSIDTEQGRQLQTYAALTAIALERQHYVGIAQDALVHIESERLRNSILSALSHDLRTPLTALVGLSESLTLSKPALPVQQMELAQALHEQTRRMSNMVSNLLDMARIQSGTVRLDLQWQYVEEVVGSALRACKPMLARHTVRTQLAADLPPVEFDAVLIERVLCNLLENAAKYTPSDSSITIAAKTMGGMMEVEVYDDGPGLPSGLGETIFEKFIRGEKESSLSGTGLGLSICRAIVEAHRGSIRAASLPEGGAHFAFTLPLGAPPSLGDLQESDPDIKGTAS